VAKNAGWTVKRLPLLKRQTAGAVQLNFAGFFVLLPNTTRATGGPGGTVYHGKLTHRRQKKELALNSKVCLFCPW